MHLFDLQLCDKNELRGVRFYALCMCSSLLVVRFQIVELYVTFGITKKHLGS